MTRVSEITLLRDAGLTSKMEEHRAYGSFSLVLLFRLSRLMDCLNDFQPHQILYLEYERDRLYAELIQQVVSRQMYWLRPLALVTNAAWHPTSCYYQPGTETKPEIYDLRQAPDLLWPASLFQVALDTEVIPLLGALYSSESESHLEMAQAAHQHLKRFMQQVWAANPATFRA